MCIRRASGVRASDEKGARENGKEPQSQDQSLQSRFIYTGEGEAEKVASPHMRRGEAALNLEVK